MGMAHRRHDMSDRVWLLLEPHLPGRAGSWGGVAQDNRRFINAVLLDSAHRRSLAGCAARLWRLENTHRRFCRWRDKGLWGALLEHLVDEPDDEWLMIDARHLKVHPHASGAVGGHQAMGRTKGG